MAVIQSFNEVNKPLHLLRARQILHHCRDIKNGQRLLTNIPYPRAHLSQMELCSTECQNHSFEDDLVRKVSADECLSRKPILGFHTHFGEITSTILSCLRDMKNFIHVRLRLCKTNSHENIHRKYCENA